jgi:hypothetical protein
VSALIEQIVLKLLVYQPNYAPINRKALVHTPPAGAHTGGLAPFDVNTSPVAPGATTDHVPVDSVARIEPAVAPLVSMFVPPCAAPTLPVNLEVATNAEGFDVAKLCAIMLFPYRKP